MEFAVRTDQQLVDAARCIDGTLIILQGNVSDAFALNELTSQMNIPYTVLPRARPLHLLSTPD